MKETEQAEALSAYSVSRETLDRLETYVQELRRWQAAINLVAPATLPTLWTRHIADSLQISALSDGKAWIDLGSGAGLPGLVLAAADPSRRMVLIESDGRKCAFLRHAAKAMDVQVEVVEARIENALPELKGEAWVMTARALAPLTRLLDLAQPLWTVGSVGLFPKGRAYGSELTDARESWRFDVELVQSRTDPDARILRVSNVISR